MARFGGEFYAGSPAVTVNEYGRGRAYYIGSQPSLSLLSHLVEGLKLKPVMEYRGEAEITRREDEEREICFVLNHGSDDASVRLEGGSYINLLTGEAASECTTVKPNDVGVFMRLKEEVSR